MIFIGHENKLVLPANPLPRLVFVMGDNYNSAWQLGTLVHENHPNACLNLFPEGKCSAKTQRAIADLWVEPRYPNEPEMIVVTSSVIFLPRLMRHVKEGKLAPQDLALLVSTEHGYEVVLFDSNGFPQGAFPGWFPQAREDLDIVLFENSR